MGSDRNRVRLQLNLATPFSDGSIRDIITNSTPPLVPFGCHTQVEIGLYNNNTFASVNGFQQFRLEIKDAENGVIKPSGGVLIGKNVAQVDFHSALTEDQWLNDQDYHAVFDILDTELATLTMTEATTANQNRKKFGMVIRGQNQDGRWATLGNGLISVVNDGATGVGAGVPPVPSYTLSDQDLQAGFAAKLNAGINRAQPIYACEDDPTKGLQMKVKLGAGGTPVVEWVEVVIPS